MADAFDAIIIGGGVIGAATLFHLTRSGCRNPLLLEQGEIAGGMTAPLRPQQPGLASS